ncbi:hypothetical protein AB1N83_005024 [Pleurotus pulmonarius]
MHCIMGSRAHTSLESPPPSVNSTTKAMHNLVPAQVSIFNSLSATAYLGFIPIQPMCNYRYSHIVKGVNPVKVTPGRVKSSLHSAREHSFISETLGSPRATRFPGTPGTPYRFRAGSDKNQLYSQLVGCIGVQTIPCPRNEDVSSDAVRVARNYPAKEREFISESKLKRLLIPRKVAVRQAHTGLIRSVRKFEVNCQGPPNVPSAVPPTPRCTHHARRTWMRKKNRYNISKAAPDSANPGFAFELFAVSVHVRDKCASRS